MDIGRFVGVEDVLGGLYARAGAVPEFGAGVFGADEEVEGVFDWGGAFLFIGVLVGAGFGRVVGGVWAYRLLLWLRAR